MRPIVAGITLVFNNARWVCPALDAIARQTHAPTQHVVIDDGSTDDSVAVMRAYAAAASLPIRFVPHTENAGITARLNEALSYLDPRPDYVVFCSDDRFDPDHLERAVAALEATPSAVAYACAMETVDPTGSHLGWRRLEDGLRAEDMPVCETIAGTVRRITAAQMTSLLFIRNVVGAASVVIRYAALERAGAYDESIRIEDHETWFRLAALGDWLYDDHPSVRYVLHGSNFTTSQPTKLNAAIAQVVVKHLDKAGSDPRRLRHAAHQIAESAGNALAWSAMKRDWATARTCVRALATTATKLSGPTRASFLLDTTRAFGWPLRQRLRDALRR